MYSMTVCKVEGCDRRPTGRGYCNPHYQRWYRHGDPTVRRNMTGLTAEERIAQNTRQLSNGCVEWTGRRDPDGYGFLTWKNKPTRAHRLSYETSVGPIPDGLLLRHTCDNPPCVAPNHLTPGTVSDNVWDMIRRNPDNPLLRGGKVSGAKKRAATHCKRDHEFTEANTYWRNEIRQCKTCRYDAWKRWYERSKSA